MEILLEGGFEVVLLTEGAGFDHIQFLEGLLDISFQVLIGLQSLGGVGLTLKS